MALERKDNDRAGSDFELRDDDRFMGYDPEPEGSHFGAFLMGGMVVAGGLLAFLYYDTDNLNGRANTDMMTGSISRTDAPPSLPSLRLSPAGQDGSQQQR